VLVPSHIVLVSQTTFDSLPCCAKAGTAERRRDTHPPRIPEGSADAFAMGDENDAAGIDMV